MIVPEAAYTARELVGDPQLAGLDAIENGAVYEMPSAFEAWDSPSQRHAGQPLDGGRAA